MAGLATKGAGVSAGNASKMHGRADPDALGGVAARMCMHCAVLEVDRGSWTWLSVDKQGAGLETLVGLADAVQPPEKPAGAKKAH